jgi:hypothetical protein
MGSASKDRGLEVERPVPTPELLQKLRAGKEALREKRRNLP